MATTHTEVYRRFRRPLQPSALRALPLARAGVRTALKKKLAWVLFVPPFIATVVFGFIVYAKFALEASIPSAALHGVNPAFAGGDAVLAIAGARAGQLIEVRAQIVQFNVAMSIFSLLIVAWYGSGLIAEDRRLGAHLLYFARPLAGFDYLLGKFLVACFFGLISVLVPGLTICTVASFSSPEWSFVTQQGSVILGTVAYALLYVATLASVCLAISSLCSRKTIALVATFGFFMLTHGIGFVLGGLQRDARWLILSPQANLRRIATSLLGTGELFGLRLEWDVRLSWLALLVVLIVAWGILARRVRQMEIAG